MKYTKQFSEIKSTDIIIAGGKGASLGEMTSVGIPVPSGFVILASAFNRFLEETNIKEEILARISEVKYKDINSVDKASNILRAVIHNTKMPEDLEDEILSKFDSLGSIFVAVRSSATAEDGVFASWAGELDTFLNTTRENIIERVQECWSSLFTPRAIFYRFEKELQGEYVSVAVVIQKMVQSEISGVAFTVHPVTEDLNQIIIEAGYGLGEAIVSGQITPDSYVVAKDDNSIIDINIGHQTRKLERNHGQSGDQTENKQNVWTEIKSDRCENQKLSNKQIIEIVNICKKIETHYGFPCDIEWCFEEGKFYITQSRPITTLGAK